MKADHGLRPGDRHIGPLLLFLAAAYAPHAASQPLWVSLWCAGGFAAALGVAAGRLRPPPKWLLGLLVVTGLALVFLSYGRLLGRDPGVAGLSVLLALKPFECGSARDRMVAVFLGFFLAVFVMFVSQSLGLAVYLLLVAAWGLSVMAHVASPAASHFSRLGAAGLVLAQAVPLAAVLFLVFPRLPSLGFIDVQTSVSGLPESLTPGELSRLALSREPVFRVDFVGDPPPAAKLYWRALVLWTYGSGTWRRWEGGLEPPPLVRTSGEVEYELIHEPTGRPWLPGLDMPLFAPARTAFTPGKTLLADGPLERKRSLRLVSATEYETSAPAEWERTLGLMLPGGDNPRARRLAEEIAAKHAGDEQIVRAVMELFRRRDFIYTLSPPPLPRHDALDAFLFDTRRGFCGHFAAAAAFLLRGAGVPARVVCGYQGGEPSPVAGYYVVRQSMAHAWVEAAVNGRGWVRCDPTAMASPERVRSGPEIALSLPDAQGFFTPSNLGPLYPVYRRAVWTWDAVSHAWNRQVLGYDRERQKGFWRSLGIEPGGRGAALLELVLALVGLAACGAATLGLWMLLQRRRAAVDPARAAYDRFCAGLDRVGLGRRPGEGPLDHLARIEAERPDLARRAKEIVGIYVKIRYAEAGDEEDVGRLKRLVASFRPGRRGQR